MTHDIRWIYEDELPNEYPYKLMFNYSKVDIVRLFPTVAPWPLVAQLERKIADLKESLTNVLSEYDTDNMIQHGFFASSEAVDLARERAK